MSEIQNLILLLSEHSEKKYINGNQLFFKNSQLGFLCWRQTVICMLQE